MFENILRLLGQFLLSLLREQCGVREGGGRGGGAEISRSLSSKNTDCFITTTKVSKKICNQGIGFLLLNSL